MSDAPYDLYTLDGIYVGPASWADVEEFRWWVDNTNLRHIVRFGVKVEVRTVLERNYVA